MAAPFSKSIYFKVSPGFSKAPQKQWIHQACEIASERWRSAPTFLNFVMFQSSHAKVDISSISAEKLNFDKDVKVKVPKQEFHGNPISAFGTISTY